MLSPRRTGRFLNPSPLLSDLDLGKQEDLTGGSTTPPPELDCSDTGGRNKLATADALNFEQSFDTRLTLVELYIT